MELAKKLLSHILNFIVYDDVTTKKVRELLLVKYDELTVELNDLSSFKVRYNGIYSSTEKKIILRDDFKSSTGFHEIGHWISDVLHPNGIKASTDQMVRDFKQSGITLQQLNDGLDGYHTIKDFHKTNYRELVACAFDAYFSGSGNQYANMIVCYYLNRNKCWAIAKILRPDNYRELRKENYDLCAERSYTYRLDDDNNSRWWDRRYRINGKKR